MKVLEIGGGAQPFFNDELISKHNIDYTIIDISQKELDKIISQQVKKICLDLTFTKYHEKYDLIFSQMVLEHLEHPLEFHKNVLEMATNEATICHFFATKYGLPSFLNRILPSNLTDYIVYNLQKRDPESAGKFKAYYIKCTGPIKKTKTWFEKLGYEVLDYNGYIGHGYLGRIKVLGALERSFSRLLLKLNSPYLTSNAILVLKKKQ
ncbi:class I SAM-dependent methyltransferase [Portibacter lacus]|uniref:class I SAM-dependent methyltransferase n=1 Tax=Portibacter lacus TaxID=1099794 RepID=UPI001F2DFD9A|nr:class I SAM-dependent methyltransferase [Portibacter lacus]